MPTRACISTCRGSLGMFSFDGLRTTVYVLCGVYVIPAEAGIQDFI